MTAPLFFVPTGALDQAEPGLEVVLDGPEARHAVQVRRMALGERVDLADGSGARVEGVVRRVDGAPSLTVEVTRRVVDPEPDVRFVLVQALAKGDRDVAAVETATELGVDEIVPWQAERSVVVWRGERGAKSRARWAATARAAAKQSRRSWVPVVTEACDTAGLVQRVAASAAGIVLHEEAARPLVSVHLPDRGDVLVVVGPEGGITTAELAQLETAGAVPVRLGSAVLRSSSAGPAALAVLSARSRWR